MNIYQFAQFIISYVVVPLIVSAGIAQGKFKDNPKSLAKMIMIKGFFYFYLAAISLIQYLRIDTNRYVVGYTIAIAIIEGVSALCDGILLIRDKH